jgi:hypothetical protein
MQTRIKINFSDTNAKNVGETITSELLRGILTKKVCEIITLKYRLGVK